MTEDPFGADPPGRHGPNFSRRPRPYDTPWGHRHPTGWGGFWLRVGRCFPGGWPWNRFALLARRLSRRWLSGAVDTRLWGHRLRLYPDRSVSEARILFLPRSWDRTERGLLRGWIRPGFTFVDVGANVGAYSFWVLSLVDERGRVVAVEPDPVLARQLRHNVRINGAGDRMRVIEAAVSASRGEGILLLAERNSGENRLAGAGEDDVGAGGTATARVRVVRLADVVDEAGLDRIDCLKVDVEGREADVIRPYIEGVPRSRWPRRMIVELGREPGSGGPGAGELRSWIAGRGYRLVRRTKLNGVFTLE